SPGPHESPLPSVREHVSQIARSADQTAGSVKKNARNAGRKGRMADNYYSWKRTETLLGRRRIQIGHPETAVDDQAFYLLSIDDFAVGRGFHGATVDGCRIDEA